MKRCWIYLLAASIPAAGALAQTEDWQQRREARRRDREQRMAQGQQGAAESTQTGGNPPGQGGPDGMPGGGPPPGFFPQGMPPGMGGPGMGGPGMGGPGMGGPGGRGGPPRPPSKPLGPVMPKDFEALLLHSMFARDSRASGAAAAGSSPESMMAFRGAALQDGEFIAFIEDTMSHNTRRVRMGEPLATGRLGAVTLDAIDYEANGNKTRVALGMNLAGSPAPAPQAAPASGGPGGPGGPPQGGGPPGGPQGPMPGQFPPGMMMGPNGPMMGPPQGGPPKPQ